MVDLIPPELTHPGSSDPVQRGKNEPHLSPGQKQSDWIGEWTGSHHLRLAQTTNQQHSPLGARRIRTATATTSHGAAQWGSILANPIRPAGEERRSRLRSDLSFQRCGAHIHASAAGLRSAIHSASGRLAERVRLGSAQAAHPWPTRRRRCRAAQTIETGRQAGGGDRSTWDHLLPARPPRRWVLEFPDSAPATQCPTSRAIPGQVRGGGINLSGAEAGLGPGRAEVARGERGAPNKEARED